MAFLKPTACNSLPFQVIAIAKLNLLRAKKREGKRIVVANVYKNIQKYIFFLSSFKKTSMLIFNTMSYIDVRPLASKVANY